MQRQQFKNKFHTTTHIHSYLSREFCKLCRFRNRRKKTRCTLHSAHAPSILHTQPLNHTWFNSLERNNHEMKKNRWIHASECACGRANFSQQTVAWFVSPYCLTASNAFWIDISHDDPITVATSEKIFWIFYAKDFQLEHCERWDAAPCTFFILGGLNTCNNERMAFSKARQKEGRNQRKWTHKLQHTNVNNEMKKQGKAVVRIRDREQCKPSALCFTMHEMFRMHSPGWKTCAHTYNRTQSNDQVQLSLLFQNSFVFFILSHIF